VELEIIRHS